uniref:Selenoprotein O n=1 Tax=Panthera tigris altaica TaxID=74533 RepID=A0A8C9MD93_PANTA
TSLCPPSRDRIRPSPSPRSSSTSDPQNNWFFLIPQSPDLSVCEADGRKVLRSSIREFLCSEAMFHLGIPTTRAGACVTSQSTVVRDVFYDGNPKYEKCTVVLRIASTFLRFGSFEIFKSADEHTGREGPSVGRNDIRVQMLDYVIGTFYPEIQAAHADNSVQRNAAFFREVTRRTARMVAEWQCVGFCHGVLNTDNMSIVGLTIDYGGEQGGCDPDHVCNASDNAGRYAYSKQPEVCKWNLQKLVEALEPELPRELGEAILAEEFDAEFRRHYLQKMRRKLGLVRAELEDDGVLVAKLLETMHLTGADFTNTFHLLSSFPVGPEPQGMPEFLDALTAQCASLEELKLAFRPQMDPRWVPRPPFLGMGFQKERTIQNRAWGICWKDELGCDSRARLEKDREGAGDSDTWQAERLRVMRASNPKYVLRNYIAQNAIEAAENGDFSEASGRLPLLRPWDPGAHTDACSITSIPGQDPRQTTSSK